MNRESSFPPLLGTIGACLGVSIGWALFSAGVFSDQSVAYATMGFAGAVVGYAGGMLVRKSYISEAIENLSRFGTAIVLLCIAVTFVTLGFRWHQSFLIYTGLIAIAGSIVATGPERGFCSMLGFATAAVVSVIALVQTGDYSWLIIAVPSLLGLGSVHVLRNRFGHRTE
jgi:hypothetical protein